ncbi:MAG TPA: cystathionine gamma-lyase, partial [Pyrinomonadaceae bacterium]
GVIFASPYYAAGEVADSPYTYGRYHNPTWTQFELALGELENGRALTFASGMAAVAAVFGTILRPGDTLLMASDCYYTARLLADGFFTEMGIEVKKAPAASREFEEMINGAKLVWIESPTNPNLDVADISQLVKTARKAGAVVAVDNTTATILAQSPLSLGADFSVASDSKALTGHSDLILGHVAVQNENLATALLKWRTQMGGIPAPMEVWLAHRSLATLEVRFERQCRNAQLIAEYLLRRDESMNVRYPGLPNDPSHATASKQMRYFGQVIAFELKDRGQAERFLAACRLITEATSFGGIHSTAERRARWGGDAIGEGFIRLSVGCEDARDLIGDMAQALDKI